MNLLIAQEKYGEHKRKVNQSALPGKWAQNPRWGKRPNRYRSG